MISYIIIKRRPSVLKYIIVRRACDTLVMELDLLRTSRTEKALWWTKHEYYTSVNMPGPMLAPETRYKLVQLQT